MPYSIAEQPRFLQITVTGAVSGPDLHQLIDEAEAVLKMRTRWAHTLVDLRGLDLGKLGFGDMMGFAGRRVSVKPPNPLRVAIVADSSTVAGYVRTLQNLNRNPEILVETFEDVAAAEKWLDAA